MHACDLNFARIVIKIRFSEGLDKRGNNERERESKLRRFNLRRIRKRGAINNPGFQRKCNPALERAKNLEDFSSTRGQKYRFAYRWIYLSSLRSTILLFLLKSGVSFFLRDETIRSSYRVNIANGKQLNFDD